MSRRTKDKVVIGFDPGSNGGFGVAVMTDTAELIDTVAVSVKNPRGVKSRYSPLMVAIWNILEDRHIKYGFTHLFYEQIQSHNGVYAAHKYGAQIGLVQFFCEQRGVVFDGVSVQHAKKALAGFSHAKKEHMIIAAAKHHGYTGNNHNEADAIGIAVAGMEKHFLSVRIYT